MLNHQLKWVGALLGQETHKHVITVETSQWPMVPTVADIGPDRTQTDELVLPMSYKFTSADWATFVHRDEAVYPRPSLLPNSHGTAECSDLRARHDFRFHCASLLITIPLGSNFLLRQSSLIGFPSKESKSPWMNTSQSDRTDWLQPRLARVGKAKVVPI